MNRDLKAYSMQKGGFTYKKIGKELGICPQRAFQLVQRATKRLKDVQITKKHLARIQGFPEDVYDVWIG